jgi:DNA-binding GntR family transcriptional regulator
VTDDWDPDAVGAAYVYAAMADHLAARIAAGEFPAGSRLPGEAELSREYQVALGTVRRALDVLRDRGLITTLAAKGSYVT